MNQELIRKQQDLTARLNRYRHEYYNLNAPSISDAVYDRLFEELQDLERQTGIQMANSPTSTVGYPAISKLEKTNHPIPLLSLDKEKNIVEVCRFMGEHQVMFMLKLDGLTIKLCIKQKRRQLPMLIGVDHGNKQIKTVHCSPFVSGLQQSITKPFGQSLQYRGNYYTLSNERIPFRKDKTEDDRFFVLTLIAIAEELEARQIGKQELYNIQLPVGLPPAHFGAQAKKFTDYFKRDGIVEFVYRDKPYAIRITDVVCYPQAYAAAATMLHTLMDDPKAVVLDIGGFTADYLLLKNGKADLTSCDSLENGVILLYNKIRSRGNSELDLLLDESDVDAILAGRKTSYPAEAVRLVERLAQEFVNDLFSTLRERMLDLRYSKVVFVGGGAILLRRQIEASGKVGTPLFVTNINANAAGFEYLYRLETAGR